MANFIEYQFSLEILTQVWIDINYLKSHNTILVENLTLSFKMKFEFFCVNTESSLEPDIGPKSKIQLQNISCLNFNVMVP